MAVQVSQFPHAISELQAWRGAMDASLAARCSDAGSHRIYIIRACPVGLTKSSGPPTSCVMELFLQFLLFFPALYRPFNGALLKVLSPVIKDKLAHN